MSRKSITLTSGSVEQTQAIGEQIGKSLDCGVVLLLIGDLGSGKTVFVQGLAKGLGVPEKCYITSPTYTLVNEYPGRMPIFHMDLYRLSGMDDLEDIGFYEIAADPHHVVAVEWADRLEDDILEDYISIHIRILDTNKRGITLTANTPATRALIQGIE